jgi:uncharacterized protein
VNPTVSTDCVAFLGEHRIATGPLETVTAYIKEQISAPDSANVLVFDSANSRVIDLDLRGTTEEVLQRLAPAEEKAEAQPAPKKRGRPKLGVVAREVTLLPRHWEWLGSQPGGASVALRKLVEQARRENSHKDRTRCAEESCYRFISAMAGNLPRFEEAARALFAGEREIFRSETAAWPQDIREHSAHLAQAAFDARAGERTGEKG